MFLKDCGLTLWSDYNNNPIADLLVVFKHNSIYHSKFQVLYQRVVHPWTTSTVLELFFGTSSS